MESDTVCEGKLKNPPKFSLKAINTLHVFVCIFRALSNRIRERPNRPPDWQRARASFQSVRECHVDSVCQVISILIMRKLTLMLLKADKKVGLIDHRQQS